MVERSIVVITLAPSSRLNHSPDNTDGNRHEDGSYHWAFVAAIAAQVDKGTRPEGSGKEKVK